VLGVSFFEISFLSCDFTFDNDEHMLNTNVLFDVVDFY